MDYKQEQCNAIYDKVYNEQKLSFEEFLIFNKFYGEVEFSHNYKKYMVLRLNDEYSSRKDKEYDAAKTYYILSEHSLYGIPENKQRYNTIEEFSTKANIKGRLLKDIWDEIQNVDFLI